MKKKKITPKSKIKKLKLNKMIVADFDTKKVKGGGTTWCRPSCRRCDPMGGG